MNKYSILIIIISILHSTYSFADTVELGDIFIDDDMVSIPGVTIDDDGVSVGGISIGDSDISMPEVSISDEGITVPSVSISSDGIKIDSISKFRIENKLITSSTILSELEKGAGSKIDLTVNFKVDSADVLGEARVQVYEIATALKSGSLSNVNLMIEGHTDADGDLDHNLDLSYRRALSVKRTLVEEYGVDGQNINIKGYGEQKPIASNANAAGKALNRRVTLLNQG